MKVDLQFQGLLEKALFPITLLAPLIFKSKTGAQLKFIPNLLRLLPISLKFSYVNLFALAKLLLQFYQNNLHQDKFSNNFYLI